MKKYRDLVTFFTGLYSDSDAKVEDPHQPPPKTPPTLGHASFRPYAEPLLQPKNGIDGPIYKLFEKSFSPMDKKTTVPNLDGIEEEQRIITPSKDSSAKLFEPPPSDLTQLLPEGAYKGDYLPAIRLAIRFTSWKQSLKEKCKRAWARWKQSQKKSSNDFLFEATEAARARLAARGIYPGPGENVSDILRAVRGLDSEYEPLGDIYNKQRLGSFEPVLGESETSPFDISDWNTRATNLESAYDALKGVLYDYQRFGLLHYRPLADSSRIWADELKDGVPIFQTIEGVIASWARVYNTFTQTRFYTEAPSWFSHSWESSTMRKYSDLHRQMQLLPSCLLFGITLFPDPNGEHNKDTYFDEVARKVTETADYLSETLEAVLRKALIVETHTDSQTLENFRGRITHILNKGVFRHPPTTYPGPLFLIEDLRKMPSHLIGSLPHHGNDDALIAAAIEDYQNNLLKMEAMFNEVLNFPGTKSSEN